MTKLHAVLVGSLLLAGGSGAMAQASDPLAQIERIPNEIIGAVTLKPVVHEAKCPGPECYNGDPTNCVFRGDCYKYAEGGRRLQDAGEKQVYDALLNVAGDALHNADPAHIQYQYLPDVGEPGLQTGPALEFSFGRRLMFGHEASGRRKLADLEDYLKPALDTVSTGLSDTSRGVSQQQAFGDSAGVAAQAGVSAGLDALTNAIGGPFG
ncbi:hypothetical protein HKI87_03g26700 [Chloropicon roscoffensis]|uniref:Uncharacterized protein n=3 Tax=Chloropicon roscoffensis TaxID=1461544 RepID=A0AAX4P4Y0_9CHLO|eukprot:CAMPEP_0198461544 /NCGR_PEP_ID=MMETSP1456-20131121/266_1 /TAXON_ID=1461544 ORGANISM="Unidentified sp., Strain RCC1871" /NCGR_SAMPLE_ID=MMETSP1456 /ASSEMBLY_ACC=CAM_ASM_001119 /LENGTH=208 /DNA_ID=CAMNT_0044186583 /DNA_START=120 /DNA_END=746 /DNA_ORIENTATION=-